MVKARDELRCPHCGAALCAMAVPDSTGWDTPHHWVCFNDDCSYYREGWDWMWEKYRTRASYRYRVVDPEHGGSTPLAVWSPDAMRDRISEEGE